jgi:membrane-bound lytic murein transglycosylase C
MRLGAKTATLLLTFCLLFSFVSSSSAENSSAGIDRDWDRLERDINRKWDISEKNLDDEWDRMQKELEAEWLQMEKAAEQKWERFAHSTDKVWVEYDPNFETRSSVDFENGQVVIEALVTGADPDAADHAKEKIRSEIQQIFRQDGLPGQKMLSDQLVNRSGESIREKNLDVYLQNEVLPEIAPAQKVFRSRDGVRRRSFQVKLEMVPNHIQVRASKFLPLVEKNAPRFGIRSELVMALIHTESCFNPKAISGCSAVGLMQIIPRWAGREAYQYIYGQDRVLSREYLFDAANNIELGCAYFSLLRYRHFKDIRGDTRNRYVAICGYNWGPTAMRNKIINRYGLNRMSDQEVYRLLRKDEYIPQETKNYIERVITLMKLYRAG